MMSSERVNELLLMVSNVALIGSVVFAFVVYILDRRKAREDTKYATYILLGDSYTDFVRLAMTAPDLQLWDKHDNAGLTDAQLHQKWALFEVLISLFERAYLLGDPLSNARRNAQHQRPWESFMRRWCARQDFSEWLPELVEDENPDFAKYILALQASVVPRPPRTFSSGAN